MKVRFDHEKLNVYQVSLKFVSYAEVLLDKIPKSLSAWSQLDRACTSIPLNIAEGNGKFTSPDRCRFFDNARGSALECAACLDVLAAKRKLEEAEIVAGKELLHQVVSMLVGLIKSNAADRLYDKVGTYGVEGQDQD
jgi:four helix bundle protein